MTLLFGLDKMLRFQLFDVLEFFFFGLQWRFEMVPVWAQVSLPFVWCQTKARLQDTHRWVQSRATVPYRDVLAVPIVSGFPGLHFATSSAPSVALTHTCPRSES